MRFGAAVVALLLSTGAVGAQDAEVQGLVRYGAGVTLEDVAVTLEVDGEPRYQTYTNRNGFYRIVGIEPGTYTLRAARIGFLDRQETVTLEPGGRRTVNVWLESAAVEVEGIVVTPDRGAVVREMGRQVVTSVDLEAVPVPAGSGDLATYLQILPGVTTTGDRGGQLYVRGGTPTENLVVVDGVPVYQPFHILGFFSIFPQDLVSSADFYAGGYGARYSGRTSSVLDVRLRDGDPSAIRATASLSPFIAEGFAEGAGSPFGGGSWLVSVRRSLVEETSAAILGEEQPLTFESQLVKVTSDREDDAWCSALALHTLDRGRIDPENPDSRVSWDNVAVGLRCSGILPDGEPIEAHLGYSSSSSSALTRDASDLRSSVWRLYTDLHTTRTLRSIPVDAGLQGYMEVFDYDLTELFAQTQDRVLIFVGSAYAEALLALGDRIEVRPGLVATISPRFGLEPRLRARWEPFGRRSEVVQGALGLYRQHAIGVSDIRDVGSVFTAWLKPETPLQALHARLGWEQQLGGGFGWALEGYYNRMWDISVPIWTALARFTTDLARADGTSYGADLRLEYRTPRFYGYLGYGYGWTIYQAAQREFANWYGDPVQSYHPPHDRRHQLNAVLAYDLAGFRLSARWQLGSGLPFTRPIGFDDAFRFSVARQNVRTDAGTTRLILERPFTGRLPAVHRLDVSAEREFELPGGDLTLRAGAINAYDRRNMFYYDLYTGRRLDQLPLAPFVSVTFGMR
jgi:hypothetical protein